MSHKRPYQNDDDDDEEQHDDNSSQSGSNCDSISDEYDRCDNKSSGRSGVYVLRYRNGTYYVGKTENMSARLAYHTKTSWRGPFEKLEPETKGKPDDLESWERNETLHLMLKHGICKVRGWMFSKTTLQVKDYEDIFRQICEKYDLCRRCGRDSHFARDCFAKSKAAWAEH